MSRTNPWNTNDRFTPDTSLLQNASLARKLVEEHQLDNSRLNDGLQELVDAVGEQASAAADVVRANTEGEVNKASDRRQLNEVEQEDRQSLIEDTRINAALSHGIREQDNRALYLEGQTRSLANDSHETANALMGTALELQVLKTQEQINAIRSEIQRVSQEAKTIGRENIKGQLNNIRNRATAMTYQKNIGGSGEVVDARLNMPSSLVENLEDKE